MDNKQKALDRCKYFHDLVVQHLEQLNTHWAEFTAKLYPLKPVYFEIQGKSDVVVYGAILKRSGEWAICVKIKDDYIRITDCPILTRLEWLEYQEAVATIVEETNMDVLSMLQNAETNPTQVTQYTILKG